MKKSTVYICFEDAIAVNAFVSKSMLNKSANARLAELENNLSDCVRAICNQSVMGEDFVLDGTGMEHNVVNDVAFRNAVSAIMREAGMKFTLSSADMDTLAAQFSAILVKASHKNGEVFFEDRKRANAKDEYVLTVSVRKMLHACIYKHMHDTSWMSLAEDHSRKAAKRARERARKAEKEEKRKAQAEQERKEAAELKAKLDLLAEYQAKYGALN